MKIVITGFSGFIGTNFVKDSCSFDITKVDLLTQKVSEIDFTGMDSILHLAALVHQMQGTPENQYFKVNRDLTYEIAKQAKAQGVKQFVFMSTAKVFGEFTTGRPAWDENSECCPQDAYGKSKYEAEKLLLSLQDENFKVAIVRSPLVYGAGVKANMYNLIKLVNRCPLLPLGRINNVRSIVYVGNLVGLLKHIIQTKASGVFIAGDKQPLSTTQLIKLIAIASNKKVILFKTPQFVLNLAKYVKPSIIDRLFGSLELDNFGTNKRLAFEPPFSSEQGIKEMVKWYKGKI